MNLFQNFIEVLSKCSFGNVIFYVPLCPCSDMPYVPDCPGQSWILILCPASQKLRNCPGNSKNKVSRFFKSN